MNRTEYLRKLDAAKLEYQHAAQDVKEYVRVTGDRRGPDYKNFCARRDALGDKIDEIMNEGWDGNREVA